MYNNQQREFINYFSYESYLLSDVVFCFAGDLISQIWDLIFSFNCLGKATIIIIIIIIIIINLFIFSSLIHFLN